MYFDAHNHLQDEGFDRVRDALVEGLEKGGVGGMMVNGTEEADWGKVLSLTKAKSWIRGSLGIHPWDAGELNAGWLKRLTGLLVENPSLHVGEIGIDEWILKRAAPDDPRLGSKRRPSLDEQEEVFRAQLKLAHALGRSATVHCIDAWERLRQILETEPERPRHFLLHAYSGPAALIPRFRELGAFFSFNPAHLDPKRQKRLEGFRLVPLARLLFETDAPAMLPPLEWRTHKLKIDGKTSPLNHPGNIEAAYQGLAAYLGVERSRLENAAEANFHTLFGG